VGAQGEPPAPATRIPFGDWLPYGAAVPAMNAICGYVLRDRDRRLTPSPLARMAEALRPEADDATLHTYELAFGGLASCAAPGAGPDPAAQRAAMREPDLTVVCAAELYNAAALRRELDDVLPRDAGEAAIIAALYRRYGLECVGRLHGAFSFALWDAQRERLLLATDAFGIQPLHYFRGDVGLVFGSRIQAIVQAPATPRRVDPQAIFDYVYFSCVPTPHTIYAGIKKIPPGHYLTFSAGDMRLERYWDISYGDDSRRLADCAPQISQYLANAVRAQATYDGDTDRVGAFLSGGTDSSAITGLLSGVLPGAAKTFSIGFAEDDFNEIAYARLVARRFGTDHHEYFVTPDDAVQFLPQLARAYDEPFGNSSAIATYYCAKLAREHGVTTLLAGDGGDELFGGNTRYVTNQVFELYHALPRWFRERCFEPSLFGLPLPDIWLVDKARKYVRRANLPQPLRFYSYNLMHVVDVRSVFTDAFLEAVSTEAPLALAADHYRRAETTSMLHRLLYLDLKIAITDNDLRKVTRMCELAGVRVRYPMLDRDLVAHSGRIPAGLKVRRFRERYAFKKGFEGFLPRETLTKKKHGFGVPVSRWLRTAPLRELAEDTLLGSTAARRGYLNARFIEQLFAWHRDDHTNFYGDTVWLLLMLELWHQAHV
jgi:asparagine synthase (glutamine-hydrolysing)